MKMDKKLSAKSPDPICPCPSIQLEVGLFPMYYEIALFLLNIP